MAEIKTITLTYKEVLEAFVKQQNIHEGIWQLYAEFGIGAGNIPIGPDEVAPAAIVPLKKLGLMKVEKEGPLTVDASIVNPSTTPS
jgi:hypothetical protein